MADVTMRAVWNRPGLFILPPSHPELGSNLFGLADLIEDPVGSHLYPFVAVGTTAPALTPTPEAGGRAPFVDVLIDTIPDGVDRITVWRQHDQRWMPVRSALGVRNVGAWTGRDYEAGFDRTLTYRVQYYQEDGTTLGFSDIATVTLPGPGGIWAWLHDPLDPTQSMKLRMLDTFAGQLSRPMPGDVANTLGQSAAVALPGTRHGLEGVALDVFTDSRSDGEQLDRMISGYDDLALGILCFRTPPETWLPGALFAFVDPKMEPVRGHRYWARWRLTGTECVPPVPAVVTPDITYDDFNQGYSTYAEFNAAYSSYLEAQRDTSVAGG